MTVKVDFSEAEFRYPSEVPPHMAAVPVWSTAVAEESVQQRLSPRLREGEAEETTAHLQDRTRYLQRKVDWLEKVHDRIVGVFARWDQEGSLSTARSESPLICWLTFGEGRGKGLCSQAGHTRDVFSQEKLYHILGKTMTMMMMMVVVVVVVMVMVMMMAMMMVMMMMMAMMMVSMVMIAVMMMVMMMMIDDWWLVIDDWWLMMLMIDDIDDDDDDDDDDGDGDGDGWWFMVDGWWVDDDDGGDGWWLMVDDDDDDDEEGEDEEEEEQEEEEVWSRCHENINEAATHIFRNQSQRVSGCPCFLCLRLCFAQDVILAWYKLNTLWCTNVP